MSESNKVGPALIVSILREAKRPLTTKELSLEVHRRVPRCVSDNIIVLNMMRIRGTIKGKRVEEVFRLIKRGVRNPDIMELDIRSKIAGNNVVHRRFEELIAKLIDKPPLALKAMKQLVNLGAASSLEAGIVLEHLAVESLERTEDFQESMRPLLRSENPCIRKMSMRLGICTATRIR
jgi:hypothetical protein